MKISKLADKEVNGLFRRQGKRGDTWIYARFKDGKMERGSLGSCDVFTLEEARRWAHLKNISAAGKVPEFTLGEVVDKRVSFHPRVCHTPRCRDSSTD